MREVEVADLIDFGEPELKMMKHKTPRKTLKVDPKCLELS